MPKFIAYHEIGSHKYNPPRWVLAFDGDPAKRSGIGIEYHHNLGRFGDSFTYGSDSSMPSNTRRTIHTLDDVPDEIAAAWLAARHKGHLK